MTNTTSSSAHSGPYDVIIIGSGAAGLTAALELAETKRVLVLAKGGLTGGSTAWAQGGIAAVLDAGDTFENHVRDTMVAGENSVEPFVQQHFATFVEAIQKTHWGRIREPA